MDVSEGGAGVGKLQPPQEGLAVMNFAMWKWSETDDAKEKHFVLRWANAESPLGDAEPRIADPIMPN